MKKKEIEMLYDDDDEIVTAILDEDEGYLTFVRPNLIEIKFNIGDIERFLRKK